MPSPPAQRAGAADDRPSPTPSFGKPSFSGWHCYACDSLSKNHRRHRGIQRPWRSPCSGSLGAGVALIAGFHVLALPCLPLGATLAVEALHLLGLALYFYIVVRSDADSQAPVRRRRKRGPRRRDTALVAHLAPLHAGARGAGWARDVLPDLAPGPRVDRYAR